MDEVAGGRDRKARAMILGAIGDDFTGSSDLANTLAKGGMHVAQFNGVPDRAAPHHIEAGVVALKSRTIPAAQAVEQSLAALDWLREQGCRQYVFKYCSTFDSTPQGNIGPVLDALLEALGAERATVCPAFPATGRSIYQGHLFVGDRLLSESGMEHHPLTPMTDPDIRRWLGLQTRLGVGHVAYGEVAAGPASIRAALDREAAAGRPHIVVDAISDANLLALGEALADDKLISGGSGIALGLTENFRRQGLLRSTQQRWRGENGPVAALCGSCSRASREQVARHEIDHPARKVLAHDAVEHRISVQELVDWVLSHQRDGRVPLIYSSADPDEVARAHAELGKQRATSGLEALFAATAASLVEAGLRRLILAGGETSGAVVSRLRIPAFEIGPEIDPGVPALRIMEGEMVLALKSGNFGAPDFFAKAANVLAGATMESAT
jgi:3-dehydrotetronate 4-kinase